MTTYAQAMRACSPMREKYILQSRMTVNGRVPTIAEVEAEFRRQFIAQPGDQSTHKPATPAGDFEQ
jgi:hypothetical protein